VTIILEDISFFGCIYTQNSRYCNGGVNCKDKKKGRACCQNLVFSFFGGGGLKEQVPSLNLADDLSI
jgi:hypothetical protein